jgi:tRNA (guanine-N7-)-methyltransferase
MSMSLQPVSNKKNNNEAACCLSISHYIQEINRLEPLKLDTVFKNNNELEVDLGCGKGSFLLAHAQKYPATNFLGIEKRAKRVELVAKKAARLALNNIKLLCSEIAFALSTAIPPASVSTYYLFFPDPWPKRRHSKRRLFDIKFMNALAATLKKNGKLHIATDDKNYYTAIVKIISCDKRFVQIEPFVPSEEERTNFEILFTAQNKEIYRYSIALKGEQ